jgi:hypothetical protein
MGLESGIRKKPIPDPWNKRAPDPGSTKLNVRNKDDIFPEAEQEN